MISGDGLVLRVATPGDRERWLEMFLDPELPRVGVPVTFAIPESLEDLDERVAQSAHPEPDQTHVLGAADESAPDRFLADVAWRRTAPEEFGVVDLSYAVHPDARGRGLAARAVRLLTRHVTLAPDGPQAQRVQIDHSVENPGSCRTALRAGFEQEGIRRRLLPQRDPAAPGGVRHHDLCLHGYLRP